MGRSSYRRALGKINVISMHLLLSEKKGLVLLVLKDLLRIGKLNDSFLEKYLNYVCFTFCFLKNKRPGLLERSNLPQQIRGQVWG